MAEVSIIWTGLDQLSKVADGVTESVRGTGKAAEESSGLFDGLGGKITGLGTILAGAGLAAGGAAILGVGKAAFDVAGDIDQASDDIAAKLGVSKAAAEGFEDVMKGVFANNFGDSFEDIGEGVVVLEQRLGGLIDTSSEAGQKALESAFALRDAFGVETEESLSAVQTLMENFGLSSDEAFDLVAAGFQRGLDRSGDFLDSVNEYATQFSNAGADASEFFSILESGAEGGALGTDKAADAFKEFRVRIQDGSTATSDALEAIGINSEQLFEKMSDGTVTASDAFGQVLEALRGVDDQNVMMQAGVGLLGTQFEDLGQEAVLALSTTQTSLEDLAGSTDALNQQYDNFGAVSSEIWRELLIALQPAMEALLELANSVMPIVADFMRNQLAPAMESVGKFITNTLVPAFEKLEDILVGRSVHTAIKTVSDFFTDVMIPAAKEVDKFFRNTIIPVFELLEEVLETVTKEMNGLWEEHGEQIQEIAKLTWTLVEELIIEVTETIREVIEVATDVINKIMEDHGDTIFLVIETVWDLIKNAIDVALDQIQNILELAIALLQGDWERAWGEIKQIVSRAIEGIFDALKILGPTMAKIAGDAIKAMAKKFSDFSWSGLGESVVDGIVGGLSGLKDKAGDAIGGALSGAKDKAFGWIKGGSPALEFVPIGESIMEGIELGIVSQSDLLENAIIYALDKVEEVARVKTEGATNAVLGALDKLHASIQAGIDRDIAEVDFRLQLLKDKQQDILNARQLQGLQELMNQGGIMDDARRFIGLQIEELGLTSQLRDLRLRSAEQSLNPFAQNTATTNNFGPITIVSNAPVSTIQSDFEVLKVLATSI